MKEWMLKIKVVKRFSNRSLYGYPGGYFLKQEELFELLRNRDVEFSGDRQFEQLLNVILGREVSRSSDGKIYKFTAGDIELLNRIMQNGGLYKYAQKLEGKLENRK